MAAKQAGEDDVAFPFSFSYPQYVSMPCLRCCMVTASRLNASVSPERYSFFAR
jgi:hypothetical protein